MNKDKLILANGVGIALEAGGSLGALQAWAADRAAMVAAWEQLTPENLASAQVKTGEGLTVGTYTDLVLVSETSIIQPDGTILTTYCLREKTAEERRLDALEAGQEVQDGAITDLGGAVSTLAEGGAQ